MLVKHSMLSFPNCCFFSHTLFLGEISAGVAKCHLFCRAKRMDSFVLVHQLGRREVS